jgi:uncharacterized membrane protein
VIQIPLAHTGHWYHAILYLLPMLLIGLGLWWTGRRERAGIERGGPRTEEALNDLSERYLAGEIDAETYDRERRTLLDP